MYVNGLTAEWFSMLDCAVCNNCTCDSDPKDRHMPGKYFVFHFSNIPSCPLPLTRPLPTGRLGLQQVACFILELCVKILQIVDLFILIDE